jgi:hypothetical protein
MSAHPPPPRQDNLSPAGQTAATHGVQQCTAFPLRNILASGWIKQSLRFIYCLPSSCTPLFFIGTPIGTPTTFTTLVIQQHDCKTVEDVVFYRQKVRIYSYLYHDSSLDKLYLLLTCLASTNLSIPKPPTETPFTQDATSTSTAPIGKQGKGQPKLMTATNTLTPR